MLTTTNSSIDFNFNGSLEDENGSIKDVYGGCTCGSTEGGEENFLTQRVSEKVDLKTMIHNTKNLDSLGRCDMRDHVRMEDSFKGRCLWGLRDVIMLILKSATSYIYLSFFKQLLSLLTCISDNNTERGLRIQKL
ncbi:hypothetical protein L2E82_11494 [Cichorium intybus]|uniref:Uncharacterized protein n=1 Tax=Cichorium intybus TaxID=13427 RepID=A0ACB9GCZ2_CICIN|nr:hypothetical protein L2E82_11494 [Cichorium intybus]